MGVDLPRNKSVEIGLTYIYGIGLTSSQEILRKAGIDATTKVRDLTEDHILKLRELVSELNVEGDLRRQTSQNIRRLQEIGCYKGLRHRRNLPCRGQRTHTNARTRRGKRVAIAGKKKVAK
jgi:small subunit ribosomal protein S13